MVSFSCDSRSKLIGSLKERGSDETLNKIPLRSILFNGGVPLKRDEQPDRSETSLNTTSTSMSKSATLDFDLLIYYQINLTSEFKQAQIQNSSQSDVARRH